MELNIGLMHKKDVFSSVGVRMTTNTTHPAFLFCLTYKADALGKTVVTVPPAYTSQRCSECGHTESRNRHGQLPISRLSRLPLTSRLNRISLPATARKRLLADLVPFACNVRLLWP